MGKKVATWPWAGGPGLYIKARSWVSQGEPANKQCSSMAPASVPAWPPLQFLPPASCLKVNAIARAWVFSPNHSTRLNQICLSTDQWHPIQFRCLWYLPLRLCLVARQTESSELNANPVSSPHSSATSLFETVTMCPPGILGGRQSAGQCVPRPFQWTISLRSCIQILLMFSNPFPISLLKSLPSAHFSRH